MVLIYLLFCGSPQLVMSCIYKLWKKEEQWCGIYGDLQELEGFVEGGEGVLLRYWTKTMVKELEGLERYWKD